MTTLIGDSRIPWTNLMSVLVDSCNVMRGSKSGHETRIRTVKALHLLDVDEMCIIICTMQQRHSGFVDCDVIYTSTIEKKRGKISVQITKTDNEKKQIWNKKHACLFCDNLYFKIARHNEDEHNKEQRVVEILLLPKNPKQRKEKLEVLRNEANFKHYFEVIKKQKAIEKKGKISVQITKTDNEKKQIWNKKHACLFCDNLYFKIARHNEDEHNKEQRVVEILLLQKIRNKERKNWKF
ncbi:unnamed protein product [Mytilus coruscus]|uniref:Uncharacterized protein n=1 Tax=Mytilus coruscus TaxID=42192 RepID=A0A6J8DY21_MYTCO|nr:unnamed protein product [Mytilus coruscus]